MTRVFVALVILDVVLWILGGPYDFHDSRP